MISTLTELLSVQSPGRYRQQYSKSNMSQILRMKMRLAFILTLSLIVNGFALDVTSARWNLTARSLHLLGLYKNTETFVDIVLAFGYMAEEHQVITEDGYVLSVHRIPGGPKSPVSTGKPIVILLHGLFGASDLWVLRGPGQDLAFLLADEGYDVWAINTRGNYYSKRHTDIATTDSRFWRFSWHEFGTYDTAAVIDYILSITDSRKLSLIGHSMGSTVKFVLLSMKPEYNIKVNVAISLAPVAIFTHLLPGLLNGIGIKYGKEIEEILNLLHMHEILPRSSFDLSTVTILCQRPKIDKICQKLIFHLLGHMNNELFDTSLIPSLLNHYPQGTSVDTLQHYRQIIISGQFRQYDFGPGANLERYKNETPPEYPLEKIIAPVVLYYGQNDAFTTEEDVRVVAAKLPNAFTKKIASHKFNHLDFVFSKDSKKLVFEDILKVLQEFGERSEKCSNRTFPLRKSRSTMPYY